MTPDKSVYSRMQKKNIDSPVNCGRKFITEFMSSIKKPHIAQSYYRK